MEFSLGSGLIKTWPGPPLGEMVRLQSHIGCRQGCTAWPSHYCTTFNSCMDSMHERNIEEYCWVKFCALLITNAKESRCIQCSVHFWPAGPFDESSLELVSWAFHIGWPLGEHTAFLFQNAEGRACNLKMSSLLGKGNFLGSLSGWFLLKWL